MTLFIIGLRTPCFTNGGDTYHEQFHRKAVLALLFLPRACARWCRLAMRLGGYWKSPSARIAQILALDSKSHGRSYSAHAMLNHSLRVNV
jgi:hypothetical protein